MTNEEKLDAITAKLVGEFYVGQLVRIHGVGMGIITAQHPQQEPSPDRVPVKTLDGRWYHPKLFVVEPL